MSAAKKPLTCKVKILGRLWTLVRKQPPHPLYDGLCCYDERKIMLGPSGLRTRRLELLAHELLHARFQELDEESILDAGRLIYRLHKKVRNYGFRMFDEKPVASVLVKAAAKKRLSAARKRAKRKKS